MKKYLLTTVISGLCFWELFALAGCDLQMWGGPQAKYERTVQRQTALAAGSTLIAETSFGSINITGADVNDCSVEAKITGRAYTQEEAQELAEQTEISLELVGKTLTVKTDKPRTTRNQSISVSFDIVVPKQVNIKCKSSYGTVKLIGINGDIEGRSSSGSITAEDIEGSALLDTSYGAVKCRYIKGDNIRLKSSSGSLTALNIEGSLVADTSYGSITCNDIKDGDIILKTSSGSIRLSNASFGICDAHTSYGSINTDEVTGDSITLQSGSGSIGVDGATARLADLKTSYGKITCSELAASELTAHSSSGSLDIDCYESSPDGFTAKADSGYGGIVFTAPPDFAGQVEMSTSYGSIDTDLPITITGSFSKKNLKGTIGSGNGSLYLKTSSGSIKLK